MPYTLILHIQNEAPILGEVEELPARSDSMIIVNNPRRLDGKDLHYLAEDVIKVYWPIDRINFIEVLAEAEEEQIIGFVRE
jgi:hypothetical protein